MIEVYDALVLKEPWLELILLELKTLETRTKLMRKKSGEVVLCSSKGIDFLAWADPKVGGLLDAAAKHRALAGRGKTRALASMSGFRPGVPGVEDERARIGIMLPSGEVRFVALKNRALWCPGHCAAKGTPCHGAVIVAWIEANA